MLSAAGLAVACSDPATTRAKPVDVALTPGETEIDLGGKTVRTWAYNGRVPAKEIRIRKGETLRAAVTNNLPSDPHGVNYRAGQRIRLRIINAGPDTAFRVGVPNTKLTVTHTDGYPVVPRETDAVILGMGERADATITLSSSASGLTTATTLITSSQAWRRSSTTPGQP